MRHKPTLSRTLPALVALCCACFLAATQFAVAAVVHEYSLRQQEPFVLGGGWGVTVDGDFNVYALDTGRHRIIKFSSTGNPIKAWGTEGSGTGQHYYPTGVAAGVNAASGGVRIYVVDNGNHRIVTYNENGKFLSAFGSEGSGNTQFLSPQNIAVVTDLSGRTQELCVTDSRNDRVTCFNEQGNWLKTFDCSDCPGGKFQEPQGITARRLDGGAIRYFVVDLYPGRIVVLNALGKHIKTIGGPGQSGELSFPDDVAVDKEGNVYAVESGVGLERVMKFDTYGELAFSFTDAGGTNFVQPHAIAIDADGDLYVGHFADPPVHKYTFKPPRIDIYYSDFDPDGSATNRRGLIELYLYAGYNGVETYDGKAVSCTARIAIAINAKDRPWLIRTALADVEVENTVERHLVPLSGAQLTRINNAYYDRLAIWANTEVTAKCSNGEPRFTAKSRSRLN